MNDRIFCGIVRFGRSTCGYGEIVRPPCEKYGRIDVPVPLYTVQPHGGELASTSMLNRRKRAEVTGVLVKEPVQPTSAEDNFALAA